MNVILTKFSNLKDRYHQIDSDKDRKERCIVKNLIKILTVLVIASMIYRRVFKLTDEQHEQFKKGTEDYIVCSVEGFEFKGPNGKDLGHYDKKNMSDFLKRPIGEKDQI